MHFSVGKKLYYGVIFYHCSCKGNGNIVMLNSERSETKAKMSFLLHSVIEEYH